METCISHFRSGEQLDLVPQLRQPQLRVWLSTAPWSHPWRWLLFECPDHQMRPCATITLPLRWFSSSDGTLKRWFISLDLLFPLTIPLPRVFCWWSRSDLVFTQKRGAISCWVLLLAQGEHPVWLYIPGQHSGSHFSLGLVSVIQLAHAPKHPHLSPDP